jgi:hypothetical protein
MTGKMCVSMISLSPLEFMDDKCSETPQFGTNKMDIDGLHSAKGHLYLAYSPLYSTSLNITHGIDHMFTKIFCSHTMSMNRSPPKTTNMAPMSGVFGTQQLREDNVGASDNNARYTLSKDTQFRQPQNQFHPLPGYCYPATQPPFPGGPQFCHLATFNMTPCLEPGSGGATQ